MLLLLVPVLLGSGCLTGTQIPVEGLACADPSSGAEPCLHGYLCDPGTSICVSPRAPTLSTTTLEVESSSLFADGAQNTLVLVSVRNAAGEPISDREVVITTTYGNLLAEVSGGADGIHRQRLQAPRSPGTATIGFTLDGTTSSEVVTVDFLPAPPAGNLVLLATPTEIPADGVAVAIVASGPVTDVQGNRVVDGTLITVVATNATTILNADADETTPEVQVATTGGRFELSLEAGTLAGTSTVTATAGDARGTTSVTLLPGTPVAMAVVSGDGQSGTAGEALTAPLRIEVVDANGNGVPDIPIDWSVAAGEGNLSAVQTTTGALGITEVVATLGPAAGTFNNTFEATSTGLGGSPLRLSATALPGPATRFSITPPGEPAVAGTTFTIQVEALDAQGNRVTDYAGTVGFASTDAAANLPTSYTFGTVDAGLHDFSLSLNTAGIWSLSVTDTADASITGSALGLDTLAVTQGDDGSSTLSASPAIVPGDGGAPSSITVNLLDGAGAAVVGERVEVTTTLGTVSPTVDNGDGTYTATLTHDVAGVATVSFTANTTLFSATTTVTFTNIAPVTEAGPDVSDAFPWDTVNLAGTGTDGNPGDRVTHQWTIDTQPTGSNAAFGPAWPGATTASRPAVAFWPDLAGTYGLRLTTTDPAGVSSSDVTTITVLPFVEVPIPATWSAGRRAPRKLAVMPGTGDLGMVTADGAAVYLGNGDWSSLDCATGTSGAAILVAPDATGLDAFHLAFEDSATLTRIDGYDTSGCTASTPFDTTVSLAGATAVLGLALDQNDNLWIGTDQNLTQLPPAGTLTAGTFSFDTPTAWSALVVSHGNQLVAAHHGGDGYHLSSLPFDPTAPHLDLDPAGIDDITSTVRGALVPGGGVDEIWFSTRAAGWWRLPDLQAASPAPIQYTTASGLPADEVHQASFDDATGDLWVATASGLARYKRDVDAVVAVPGGSSGLCNSTVLGLAVDAFEPTTRGHTLWVACSDQLLILK